MSTVGSYPVTSFSASQYYLVWNPSTQSLERVLGSDIVSAVTPNTAFVYSESTRSAALTSDYEIGALIQTAGGDALQDGGEGMYLVVAAGEGDFPMLNGNELVVLPRGSLAGSDLDGALVTDETATAIEDSIAKRAVRFANLEAFRASSCSYPEVIVEAANSGTTTGRMILKATGTSAGTPTLTAARFTALAAGEIINEGGYGYALEIGKPVNPYMFGASSGGANDSTALGLTFSCGASRIDISDEFAGDNISIGSAVRLIYGGGKLVQYTHDTANILTGTSISNVRIAGVDFEGVSAGNYDVEAFNNAIYLTSCTNVKIYNCSFDGLDNQAVYARTSSRIYVNNNDITGCSAGVRFNGVTRGEITNNILTDCALADGTFVTAISLNSRGVSGGGPNKAITISGNQIEGYLNSQGILVHDGNDIKIIGNTIDDSTWGIGCNCTGASDEVINICISGNTIVGSTSVLGSETGEYGIFVGAATGTTRNITINGNQVSGANTVWQSVNEGGIGIGGGSNIHVYGNTCYSCYSNGIVVNQDNVSRLRIHDNIIDTINTGDSSANRGIAVIATAGTVSGWIYKNKINGATDGIRVSAAQGNSLVAVENDIEGATTDYVGTANMVYGNAYIGPYTSLDTTPSVKNAKTLYPVDAGANTWTTLDDMEIGQTVEFIFQNANTSITDSSPFFLNGNFTSANRASLVLKKLAATTIVEISRLAP